MSARRTRSATTLQQRLRAPAGLPTLESSRARIHQAALQLFARYGYDGTSLQMIADAVGLHKSTLFHHYRGKLDVAAEAFEAAMARVAEHLQPLVGEEAPRLEAVFAVSDALVDHFSEEPEAARMIVWMMTAPRDSDLNLQIFRDEGHPVVTIFTTLWAWIDRARRAGTIRPVNIRQTIFNLVGLVVFYPAAAEANDLSGDEPFSAKARRIRKEELRLAIRGIFETR
jgi:AcrR family transcriptional regulator